MIKKLSGAVRNPRMASMRLLGRLYGPLAAPKRRYRQESGIKELDDVQERSLKKSDIGDHLVTLFLESLGMRPKLMVELGVGNGESTFALERVARLCDSVLVSVDLEDCSHISSYGKWFFVQKDDIEFGDGFEGWCRERRMEPRIDVLFIDTSHYLEHTLKEIDLWFPYLSERSKVFFHDTNLKEVYFRKDGSFDFAWDNKRGVIRALEEFFKKSFNENEDFVDVRNGWIIRHFSHCNGFTILEKCALAKDTDKYP